VGAALGWIVCGWLGAYASLGFSFSSIAAEKKVMNFVTAAPLDSDLAKLTTMVLTEAFKRLGYGYTIVSG